MSFLIIFGGIAERLQKSQYSNWKLSFSDRIANVGLARLARERYPLDEQYKKKKLNSIERARTLAAEIRELAIA